MQLNVPNGHVDAQINNLHSRENSADDGKIEYDSVIKAKSISCLLDPEVRFSVESSSYID